MTRSWFGNAVLVAFCAAQLADGVLTYVGVKTFGSWIEANPVLAWYLGVFGVGVALIGATTFAIVCAGALHLRAMHRTLGLLTILYLSAAVFPWTRMLWP